MSDLIDREALLGQLADKMREHECYDTYTDGQYSGMDRAFSMIENAPAVDAVEVVHAVWNHLDINPKYHTHIVECSECGAIFNVSIFDWGLNYNFCPNCGARMDGE